MSYAKGTSVPVERTRVELERLLVKHGATQHAVGSDLERGVASVMFTMVGRRVRLTVPLPMLADYRRPSSRWAAPPSVATATKRHAQASRARWRAVLLLTKAKLEAIALGLSSVEREFLSDVLLANGLTVYEQIADDVASSYLTGVTPPLLGRHRP